jgi:pyrroloquinoline quinone biosynthesis protein D
VINGLRVFSLSGNVSFQRLGKGEGAVVLAIDTGQLHTCNDTTAAFLAALDGKRTFDMVVAELEKEFEVEREELRADLAALAARLIDEGVIV